MTLADVISTISAVDKISIHNADGYVLFDGLCQDLRAVYQHIVKDYIDCKVDRIRAYNDFIIILLL